VDAIEDAATVLYAGQFDLGFDPSELDTDVPCGEREYDPEDLVTEVPVGPTRGAASREEPLSSVVWLTLAAMLALLAVILAMNV